MSDSFAVRDQRQPGWFFIDNEVVDQHSQRLGAYGIAVYCVLSRYAKSGTQQVNLSARDIGNALGISQDRVRKSLADLVDVGLIHLQIPERPAPGLFSTITLLNVKVNRTPHVQSHPSTERHTFSSGHELNATRSPYKEVKTKTKTETDTHLPFSNEILDLSLQKKNEFSQSDFDARDLRLIRKAQEKFHSACRASTGTPLPEWMHNDRRVFEWICSEAGITVKRGIELEQRQKEWPEAAPEVVALK
jgi:hypothetical protein